MTLCGKGLLLMQCNKYYVHFLFKKKLIEIVFHEKLIAAKKSKKNKYNTLLTIHDGKNWAKKTTTASSN